MDFNKELKELLEKYAKETGTVVNVIDIDWYYLQSLGRGESKVSGFKIQSEYKK